MRSLDLYLHDQLVGKVGPDGSDRTRVTMEVAPGFSSDVVLSESFSVMPGRRVPSDALSNFLGGYIPEGNHRQKMAAKRGIDSEDLFALLREFGGSIAGAVTLREPATSKSASSVYEPLAGPALSAKLKQALEDSDQGIPDDSRSTLPGYQPKVLVARFDDVWLYPHGSAHSTHILKPQVPGRPSRIYDEFYSHELTRHVGLSEFESEILRSGNMTYLAIERFDRVRTDEVGVSLLHQEDLAQVMSLDWRNTDVKFQEPRWPGDPKRATIRRIAEALGSIPDSRAAIDQWIRQLTYHVAIGNNDAHAKNVALMHSVDRTSLSQVYDAVPNLFQEGLTSWDLALSVDGVFDHRKLSVDRLLREIASWKLVPESRAKELVLRTLSQIEEAMCSITVPGGVSLRMVEQLEWNVMRLLSGAEISTRKR